MTDTTKKERASTCLDASPATLRAGVRVRVVMPPPSPYDGLLGMVVAVHEETVRARRYDVALDEMPHAWYCFRRDELVAA